MFYHNTTARYNGYFNAKEIMKATMLTLEEQQQHNYTQLLDLYPYSPETNIQSVKGELDRDMEKVTRVVALHRISEWTDDCYLLAGQAQFLAQDYESAEETLRYLLNNFDPVEEAKDELREERAGEKKSKKINKKKLARQRKREAKRKRREYNREVRRRRKGKSKRKGSLKKEEEEEPKVDLDAKEEKRNKIITDEDVELPDNYFLKHRPAFQEGRIWLAKTLIERDNYDGAARILQEMQEDPRTFDDLKEELWTTQAYLHLVQENQQLAIAPLQNAITFANSREKKAHYSFMVAQLLERVGRVGEAVASYEDAIRYSNDYELEFNARLNMTIGGYRAGTQSSDRALQALEALLKDDKNLDYAGQIYYAMAEIALQNGQKEKGIAYLKQSLRQAGGNPAQIAESYLTLGDLFYESEAYVQAKLYYDSTLTSLPKQDERYPQVSALAENLTDIARNITMIEMQDSLIRIGELTPDEQRELAYTLLKEQQEAARTQAARNTGTGNTNSSRGQVAGRRDVNLSTPALRQESSFFAYDDRSVKRGVRDFQQRWGNRTLQDNWRRSSNQGIDTESAQEVEEEEIVAAAATALTDEQMDELLGDVPRTESDRRRAELKILEAMYELGVLYRDRLNNNVKAIETLEELNQRFPRNNYQLDSWYYLYLAYRETNQMGKADAYKNKIIEKYAGTNYAKVLQNPNYADQLANKEREINMYYDQALKAFQDGRPAEARQMAEQAKIRFGADNPLQPRFALLSAMAVGSQEGEAAYKQALAEVISKYNGTDAQRRAREILRILGDATAALPGEAEEAAAGNFKMNENQVHFMLVVFSGDVNLNTAKVSVSDYHREYHKLDRLRISNIFLGNSAEDRVPMLIVRSFKNSKEAMKYYNGAMSNRDAYIPSDINYEVFAVSLNNYREVLRNKSLQGYRSFFESNYVGPGGGIGGRR